MQYGGGLAILTNLSKRVLIRPMELDDAKRFFEILNGIDLEFFSVAPMSIQDEIEYLSSAISKQEDGILYSYAIIVDDEVVGGVSLKIDVHRKHIGEIGYFVCQEHQNKGIATQAVKLVERAGFEEFDIKRMQILIMDGNGASEMVAMKCGYYQETHLRGYLKNRQGKYVPALVYCKLHDRYCEEKSEANL